MVPSPAFDILIANARLLQLDSADGDLYPADVAIKDGRIARVTEPGMLQRHDVSDVIDAANGVVMPGLVNAHTHSPENLARGRAQNARLAAWLAEIWPALDRLSLDKLRFAIELGAAEMIRHGITSVVDHFRQTPMTEAALMAAIEAYGRTGLRTTIAVMLRDAVDERGALVGAPHAAAVPSATEQVELVLGARGLAESEGIVLAFGPSAPHRCSDRLLDAIAVTDTGLQIHTHVDETRDDAAAAQARFGCSTIAHLHRLGLLGPRTACAHAVHIGADDIDLLAARETTAIHNPLANLRLGSGVADLVGFLQAGVPIAFGTDGAASNDTQNLWEVIKTAALLPRVAVSDENQWPAANTLLKLATEQGHRVTGLAFREPLAGHVVEGAPADLVVFDDDPLAHIDADRPAGSLVLGSPGRRPRHVIACGRVLLRDGTLTTIDEDRLRRSFGTYTEELAA